MKNSAALKLDLMLKVNASVMHKNKGPHKSPDNVYIKILQFKAFFLYIVVNFVLFHLLLIHNQKSRILGLKHNGAYYQLILHLYS